MTQDKQWHPDEIRTGCHYALALGGDTEGIVSVGRSHNGTAGMMVS